MGPRNARFARRGPEKPIPSYVGSYERGKAAGGAEDQAAFHLNLEKLPPEKYTCLQKQAVLSYDFTQWGVYSVICLSPIEGMIS
jgi:hypothetical protein